MQMTVRDLITQLLRTSTLDSLVILGSDDADKPETSSVRITQGRWEPYGYGGQQHEWAGEFKLDPHATNETGIKAVYIAPGSD